MLTWLGYIDGQWQTINNIAYIRILWVGVPLLQFSVIKTMGLSWMVHDSNYKRFFFGLTTIDPWRIHVCMPYISIYGLPFTIFIYPSHVSINFSHTYMDPPWVMETPQRQVCRESGRWGWDFLRVSGWKCDTSCGISGGFLNQFGVPQARWLVYFMENPNLRWMMAGGCSHFRKPPSDEKMGRSATVFRCCETTPSCSHWQYATGVSERMRKFRPNPRHDVCLPVVSMHQIKPHEVWWFFGKASKVS